MTVAELPAPHRVVPTDTPAGSVFDHLAVAAGLGCGAPIVVVLLAEGGRHTVGASTGLPGQAARSSPAWAACAEALGAAMSFDVADARADPRLADLALVTGNPGIRALAGVAIVAADGERLGCLCVADTVPRAPGVLDAAQRALLHSLARVAGACLAERRQQALTAARLHARESGYRAIVEDQTELVSLARTDGTLTFVNAAYARHFGLQPEEMQGRSLFDFVADADRAAVAAYLAQLFASGQPGNAVNRMVSAEGAVRWVAWSNRSIADPARQGDPCDPAAGGDASGLPARLLHSVGRDITAERLAEEALAAGGQRQRHLYEATPAALHSIDTEGRLLHVSDRWLELLGYRRDEVIGRPSTDFLTPASAARAREQVLPAFFESGRCDAVEYCFLHKDGTPVDVLLSARLERGDDGRPTHSLAIIEDTRERKRLSTELGRAHAHLQAVVDNVPAMMGLWDEHAITRFANRDFQAATGLPIGRIVGRPLEEIYRAVDPTGYAQMAPHLQAVLGGRRQDFECALLGTSGLRQLRVTLVPAQPEPGRVEGFYGLWYDITGRKALELRLTDSEQRYRSLFDNLNSGFALHEIVVDATGKPVDYRFLALNAAFTATTGLEPAGTIGKPATALLPGIEHDPADWIGRYGRVALTGEAVHFEQRAAVLDRWFDVVAYRPAPGQFAVITQDITARKKTEVALALSEQRLRLLVDAVRDHSMVLLDAEGRVATWNLGAQRILGHAEQDIVGKPYGDLTEPADPRQGGVQTGLAQAIERGHVASEGWRTRGDGRRFWAETTLTAIDDGQGTLQGFVEITRDLTESRRQRDMIEQVAELSPSAMLLVDAEGLITFTNAQTLSIFGWRQGELIGRHHGVLLPQAPQAPQPRQQEAGSDFMFLPPADAPTPAGATAGAAQAARRELTARRKDGSSFEVQAELRAFETPDGPATLVALVDITERRRQQQRLEDALAEKETLLKEVYHRVKNNLQVVQSLLSLRRTGLAESSGRQVIDDTVQRVRAMALVHEKLYQSGHLDALSLADYTQGLLKQIGEATDAAQRRVRLVVEIEPLHTGLDNAIPFGLLVTELVSNALKHGFKGRAEGCVTVSLQRHEGGALLRVRDDGVGLPAAFELAASVSMGLQLAASLARQLGGELQAGPAYPAAGAAAAARGTAFTAVLTRL